MPYYTYEELQNNTDGVLGYTLDIYSIHQAFIKILKLTYEEKITNTSLAKELLINHYEHNHNYSKILKKYAYYLAGFLVENGTYKGTNPTKAKVFVELINIVNYDKEHSSLHNEEVIFEKMQALFYLFQLFGTAKDIISFVEDFNLFPEEQKLKLASISFNLEPSNGCDLPE